MQIRPNSARAPPLPWRLAAEVLEPGAVPSSQRSGCIGLPELLRVPPVRCAVRGVVVLEVAAALACLEPVMPGARPGFGPSTSSCSDSTTAFHDSPCSLPSRASHAPRTLRRRAVDHAADGVIVDAEVVPVDDVVQVVETPAPRPSSSSRGRRGGQAAFTFRRPTPHAPPAPAALSAPAPNRRRRTAVTGRPGIELQEEASFPSISAWPEEPAAVTEAHRSSPDQHALLGLGHCVALVAGLLELDAQAFVEQCQHAVDQGTVVPPTRTNRSPTLLG